MGRSQPWATSQGEVGAGKKTLTSFSSLRSPAGILSGETQKARGHLCGAAGQPLRVQSGAEKGQERF